MQTISIFSTVACGATLVVLGFAIRWLAGFICTLRYIIRGRKWV